MSEVVKLIADARAAAFEGRYADAAAHATAALGRLPTCLLALRILAWAQLEVEPDEARATFQTCAELDPEDALAHVGQAIWHQRRGQNVEAVSEWVRAWELDPENQLIRRALVKLTGELPESEFADAISLLRQGQADEAAQTLGRVRLHREEPAVALALIAALWSAGAQPAALELALNVLARHPRSVKAALYVAALEDRSGRTLRSREAVARVEQVDPGLALFGDVVRQLDLQPSLDLHRASRAPVAVGR